MGWEHSIFEASRLKTGLGQTDEVKIDKCHRFQRGEIYIIRIWAP